MILLTAAGLRLYRLDLAEFKFDEASSLQSALAVAHGVWLRVTPFSGSVANHPPVFAYTLALPYLFTRDYTTIATVMALLDVLMIALTGLITRRHFGLRAALLTMLLMAVAPWPVQMARKTWQVSLLIYHTPLLAGLLEAVAPKSARGARWALPLAGLGLALSVGTHLSAIYLVPVTLLTLPLARRASQRRAVFTPRALLISVLPLLLLAGVYLGYDAGQDYANMRALLGAGAQPGVPAADALRYASWLSGGAHLSDLTGRALPAWQALPWARFADIDVLQQGLLLASIALLAILAARQRSAPLAVLLVWVTLPVLLQLRPPRPLQPHYLLVLYPVPFMLMGIAADRILANARPRLTRLALAGALLAIVGWQIHTTVQFTEFVAAHDTSDGGYGPPVRAGIAAAAGAREALRTGGAGDVIVVAEGGDPAVNGEAATLDVLLADLPHRFVPADGGMILRGAPVVILFGPHASGAVGALLPLLPDAQVHEYPVYPDGEARYTLVQAARAALPPMAKAGARWANGARLLGVTTQRTPAGLAVSVYLSIEALPASDQHWFARAFAGAQQLAQQDIGGVRPSEWRVGDVVALPFVLSLAPGSPAPDRIRLGAYAYPEITQTMVLDSAGNPADDGVFVPASMEE